MFRTARSPLGALALLLLLAPSIAGCSSIQRTPFDNGVALDRVTGVTMRSGSNTPFAARGASISNDTLYALGSQGQLKLPADSVTQVWHRRFSPGRTVGLVAGLSLVA
ncbi:MAG: hypothetical protein JWM95_2906, partial [Gemmatimonadetes bacterium]|nr:hypothetical protein [Gemmatimonadota bacterium]